MKTAKIADTMRVVQADCTQDAIDIDGKPFTGRAIGEQFGSTLAMLAAVARAVELLAESLAESQRVMDSRTEHLV